MARTSTKVFVLEVMGRHAGWIAAAGGLGGEKPGDPPQIILFLQNLWEYSEEDDEIFRDEIHTTYLHELGHYLGLDEDDLWERELD